MSNARRPAAKTTTARKAPAKKATTSRRGGADTPTGVGINFDTWARDEAVEPFVIVIGGKRYESLDPFDLDFRELERAMNESVEEMFRLLFPDDVEEILANKVRIGAMAAFSDAVAVHFGLSDFVAAQG